MLTVKHSPKNKHTFWYYHYIKMPQNIRAHTHTHTRTDTHTLGYVLVWQKALALFINHYAEVLMP